MKKDLTNILICGEREREREREVYLSANKYTIFNNKKKVGERYLVSSPCDLL